MTKTAVLGILDPTSYLPLLISNDEIENFASLLTSIHNLFNASEGRARAVICEDTAHVIMESHGALQGKGGFYRQCARALIFMASHHLLPLESLSSSISAELSELLQDEAKIYTRDEFANFANLAVSVTRESSFKQVCIIVNIFSKLPLKNDELVFKYLNEDADLKNLSISAHREQSSLLEIYGLIDPIIAETMRISGSAQYVWEKTGHGASNRQKRIIEYTCSQSQLILQSATTYHNPNGSQSKSVVSRKAEHDQVQFYVCDNGDVLGGIFKTKARTNIEAQTCLRIIEQHFNIAVEKF